MARPDPFAWISREHEKPALLILLVLVLGLSWALATIGRPLQTDVAPLGIISFEVIGSEHMAIQTLYSWREAGRIRAAFVLGLDYAYLVVYASFLGLLARAVSRWIAPRQPGLAAAGPWVAWGFVLAGLCDAIENAALVAILFGARGELAPQVALWTATLKFSLIGAGMLFVLVAAATGAVGRRGGASAS